MEVENLIFNIRRTGDVAGRGVDRLGRSLKNLHKSSQTANKGLGGLLHTIGRLAKMMVLRQAIRAVMKALSEGLKNAYMFNQAVGGEMSKALDQLKSASVQATGAIGSAFGELLANVSPILIYLLNLVSKVADSIAQLFAVLGGRSQYTKAVASSEKWAKATQSGAKAAKEWKNQLLGFDEINRLEDNSSNGGGSGSGAYDGAFQLADATNKWAEEFRKITMDWWSNLNFEPLINAWTWLKEVVGEFVSLVDQGLKWAYENVLLPFGTWTIEEAAPALITLLASALDFLNTVIEKLAPHVEKLWNEYLKPFVAWCGDKFINVIEWLIDGFEGLTDKVKDANSLADFIASLDGKDTIILALVTAFALLTLHITPLKLLITGVATAAIWLKKQWDELTEGAKNFSEAVDMFFGGIGERIKNAFQPALDVFDAIRNKIADAINAMSNFFLTLGGGQPKYQPYSHSYSSHAYATGGYPDTGELFLARENGAELVGSIGNRTAVMNNDQIVASVASGVAEAVSAVMGNQNGQPVSVKVYLDSREIKAGQQRLARAMG